ncbi:dual specificity phosphatase, catalytic domain protein, partial [Opisthorchis viverrini]
GLELVTKDTEKQFKPVSVQALWAAFQAVNRACHVARTNAYFSRGLTHDWISYYHNLPASDTCQMQEWLKTDDIDSFNRYVPPQAPLSDDATDEEKERRRMETLLAAKLQEIMYSVDLEEVTVLQLRQRLEEELQQPLRDYRHFIEEEVLTIYGRMDEASAILDHLLLGTTFNASNRAELERRSVSHILNVTREVDNFFPGEKFEYKNIRVYDDEQSSLLSHFEEIHRFINEAKAQGTACLVHCKMGISRSATAVIAYVMKEHNWDLDTAFAFVKCRRPCIQPNPTFMRELRTYQGILEASSNRHKPIFCKEPAEFGRSPNPIPYLVPESSPNTAVSDTASRNPEGPPSCTEDLPPRSSASTPTPALSSSSSDTRTSSSVDLEVELFAYKQCNQSPGLRDVLALIEADPCAPFTLPADPSSQPGVRDFGPYRVWDLGGKDVSQLTYADRSAIVLAQNSHCLRQWHPDLVENVNQGDIGLVTKMSVKSLPQLRFGDVSAGFSEPIETIEEISIPPIVEPLLIAPGSLPTERANSPLECHIHVHQHLAQLALPIISSPSLLYTGVERHADSTETVLPLTSRNSANELRLVESVRPFYVFKMACKLAEPCTIQSSLICSNTTPKRPNQVTCAPCPRASPQSPHRHLILPGCSNSLVGGSPQIELVTSRLTRSAGQTPVKEQITLTPSAAVPSSCTSGAAFERMTYWSKRRDSASAQDTPPTTGIFRSARNPPTIGQVSPIGRTQSVRARSNQTSTLRLRPDNSWIVCPNPSSNAITEADNHLCPPGSTDKATEKPLTSKSQSIPNHKVSQLRTQLLQPPTARPSSEPTSLSIVASETVRLPINPRFVVGGSLPKPCKNASSNPLSSFRHFGSWARHNSIPSGSTFLSHVSPYLSKRAMWRSKQLLTFHCLFLFGKFRDPIFLPTLSVTHTMARFYLNIPNVFSE